MYTLHFDITFAHYNWKCCRRRKVGIVCISANSEERWSPQAKRFGVSLVGAKPNGGGSERCTPPTSSSCSIATMPISYISKTLYT